MQLKDDKNFKGGLNTDDNPSQLPEGDYTDAKNVRALSSSEQHGAGVLETLQSEINILINPDSLITYYGSAIGGSFVYEGYNEIVVGSQTWMKKNYSAEYPGSKSYDNNADNDNIYGKLYTHNQVMAADFVPDGWRVPTEADIDILLAELIVDTFEGGKMKEVGDSHWLAPNTGAVDSAGFRALPGGKFDLLFDLRGENCLLWLQDDGVPTPPIALNGSSITAGSFIANWSGVTGADGYYLDVATDEDFTSFVAGYEGLDVGNVLNYEVIGLIGNTEYFFRVRAYNEVPGASGNSNTQSITTLISELLLTFDAIANVPVADASSVSDWNTFFDLPTLGTAFTSVSVVGNVVNLRGGSGITVKGGLFYNDSHILDIIDTSGCIIAAGTYCFYNTNLINPSLPALSTIGSSCFENSGLINPSFPTLTTTTGTYCFKGCTGFIDPSFPALTTAGNGCFFDCTGLVNPSLPVLIVADTLCFKGCTGFIDPSFPALTTAGNLCFSCCTGLVNPSLPALTTTGDLCFNTSTSLTTINLPVCTDLGTTVENDSVFSYIAGNTITLTVPAALMTCNGGNPDGDIAYLQANNTVTIIQV